MSGPWVPGRRDVVGLFKPMDFVGRIFEIELDDADLSLLLADDPEWLAQLRRQVADALADAAQDAPTEGTG